MSANAQTLVIGLGNDFRCDDGASRIAARKIQTEAGDAVRVIEESGEGAALMDAWREAECVILIDAVHSGAVPGTIHRLDARAQPIPSNFFQYSTHAFSVAEAVARKASGLTGISACRPTMAASR